MKKLIKTERKVLAIFDFGEDLQSEINLYEKSLNLCAIDVKKVLVSDDVNLIEDGYYDVLLFDWGGMSLGNSMLEHFCGRIFDKARNSPDKHFIMLSLMTNEAMVDLQASKSLEKEEIPYNIFSSLKEYSLWLRKYKYI